MWRTIGTLLSIGLLALTSPTAAAVQVDAGRMHEVVQSYAANQRFMGTVLVADTDKVLFSRGYGFSDLDQQTPNSSATRFRIGSVTKQFTAAAILLLAERGKLSLEDPVSKHLGDMPAAWKSIKLIHLLTHTAGLRDYTTFPAYGAKQFLPTTVPELIGRFRDLPLDFEPGSQVRYSSSGYVVLGAVVEAISSQSFRRFLDVNIFEPAGMQQSGYDASAASAGEHAKGYVSKNGSLAYLLNTHASVPYAAGALFSTVGDLLLWNRALFAGKLLSATSVEKMTTAVADDYGLGVRIQTYGGRKVIQHGGNIDGFSCALAYYPDTKVTVIVLGNIRSGLPEEIAGKLGLLAHGDTVRLGGERLPIPVAADLLHTYVGVYALASGVNLYITVEGGELVAQQSGQGKGLLLAASDTVFFAKNVDAQFEFFKNSGGRTTHLVLRQGGRDRNAERISDAVAQRQEIVLAEAVLAKFVGRYELREGLDIEILLEGGQLYAQPTRQQKDPLFAESEQSFFSKRIDVQIGFELDADGKVTHLVLHQGRSIRRAARK